METALEKLHKLWDAGEHRKALRLAAGWPQLGKHRDAIRGGWAAAAWPGFYIELGKDPAAMYTAGLAALAKRYNLTLSVEYRTETPVDEQTPQVCLTARGSITTAPAAHHTRDKERPCRCYWKIAQEG